MFNYFHRRHQINTGSFTTFWKINSDHGKYVRDMRHKIVSCVHGNEYIGELSVAAFTLACSGRNSSNVSNDIDADRVI